MNTKNCEAAVLSSVGGDICYVPGNDFKSPNAMRWWSQPTFSGENKRLTSLAEQAWYIYSGTQPETSWKKQQKRFSKLWKRFCFSHPRIALKVYRIRLWWSKF